MTLVGLSLFYVQKDAIQLGSFALNSALPLIFDIFLKQGKLLSFLSEDLSFSTVVFIIIYFLTDGESIARNEEIRTLA